MTTKLEKKIQAAEAAIEVVVCHEEGGEYAARSSIIDALERVISSAQTSLNALKEEYEELGD